MTASSSSSDKHQLERWNTHFSTCVEQEVLGVNLRLAQDPNSEHLGTTVWDASIVLAKFFEKNIRKGEFSRPKMSGKRAIELGAGMGLAGLACALLGADVLLTDVKEVLPLLTRNYENNLSHAALRASGAEGHLCSCGKVKVQELDWSVPEQYQSLVPPPFDYVLAADCIYHEHLVRHLYRAVLALTNERTTIIIANERRSESVQAAFTQLFSASFTFKKVPLSKQDPDFSHPLIELYLLKRRKGASDDNLRAMEEAEAAAAAAEAAGGAGEGVGGGDGAASAVSMAAAGGSTEAACQAEQQQQQQQEQQANEELQDEQRQQQQQQQHPCAVASSGVVQQLGQLQLAGAAAAAARAAV